MSEASNTYDSGRATCPGTITSSLLGGVKESQDDAWARMSLLYGPLVYFWCRQTGLQPSDADDVVQEVLRTILMRIGEFERTRTQGTFRGWLRTITWNKVGDFIRSDRRRRQLTSDLTLLERLSVPPFFEEDRTGDAARRETRLVCRQILELIRSRFAEPTWHAFLRVVMDGAAPRDVAEELGLSVESVYQAKSRVLRRLRDELRDLGD